MSMIIAYVILKGTWSLFTDSLRLMVDAVPKDISLPAVKAHLEALDGVKQVHDLHIWALSTRENALSVHLWMPDKPLDDKSRAELTEVLTKEHGIHHITIQVEGDLAFCQDSCG